MERTADPMLDLSSTKCPHCGAFLSLGQMRHTNMYACYVCGKGISFDRFGNPRKGAPAFLRMSLRQMDLFVGLLVLIAVVSVVIHFA